MIPAAILALLKPLLPYILVGIAAAVAYLGIRRQGVVAERERNEKAQEAARVEVEMKVKVAESKDAAIDQRVKEEIDALPKVDHSGDFTGDRFKF